MKRDGRKTTLICLLLVLLLLASCASSSLLGRAKQSAAASYSVYEPLTSQVVSEIQKIVEKNRAGTITESDRTRLKSLDQLRKILDDYAKTHNLFVQTTKTWEVTNREPSNAALLENQLLVLINRALDEAKELELQVPAGLR
jgi:DNA-binding transcriptional regulator YiaG